MARAHPTLAVLCVALAACEPTATDGTLSRIRESGVLRWGGDVQGGEPYVSEDPHHPGRLVGFEVELADALAGSLVRAEFVQNDWSSLIPSLERGTFDIALNGIEVTPGRASRVLFTRPYYLFGQRLMARADDPRITDLESLRGMRVGTLANSQAWDLLRSSGAIAVPYEGTEEPYIDLVEGRTDAVLLDDIIADRYGAPKPGLRVVGDIGEGQYAIAVRQGDEDLRDALDAGLAQLARSGALRAILARAGIDNERQARLATWTDADTEEMVADTAAAPSFSAHHVWLFVQGAGVTLVVSTLAMALAIALGLLLAITRYAGPGLLEAIASGYVELFRGTPVLLQLYVLYFGLAPWVSLDPVLAAVLGLGLNYAAYEAEVYRAGIQAVPPGQMEAAAALGMSHGLALRRVLVPQAFRIALPSVTNDFIALLKDSSLVSVITVVELTKQMTITAVDVRGWLIPGALCAGLYFVMSYPLSLLSRRLERKLARS